MNEILSTDVQYAKFFKCIQILCGGKKVKKEIREGYKKDSDLILLIQDHIGTFSNLVNIHNFHCLAVVEMAEAYALYHE